MNQVVTENNSIPVIEQRVVTQAKMLDTQVPNFRGSRDIFNEFENLLLNHQWLHQHRITEGNKIQFFKSLSRDETTDFWQPLRNNSSTIRRDVLIRFRQEAAHEDFKEVF